MKSWKSKFASYKSYLEVSILRLALKIKMTDKRQQKYLHQFIQSRFHIRSLTIKIEKPHINCNSFKLQAFQVDTKQYINTFLPSLLGGRK